MNSLACYQFAHEMRPGDHVVATKGGALLLGHGIVESDYEFDDNRAELRHVRRVSLGDSRSVAGSERSVVHNQDVDGLQPLPGLASVRFRDPGGGR